MPTAETGGTDDDDPLANSTSLLRELVERDPRNRERILPFYGGEDITSSTDTAPQRWIITFGDMSEKEASAWPDLFNLCRERVVAERQGKSKDLESWPFWRFWRIRSELQDAASGLSEVLTVSQTGNALAFRFMPLPSIFGNTVVVFPTENRGFLGSSG